MARVRRRGEKVSYRAIVTIEAYEYYLGDWPSREEAERKEQDFRNTHQSEIKAAMERRKMNLKYSWRNQHSRAS